MFFYTYVKQGGVLHGCRRKRLSYMGNVAQGTLPMACS